MLYLRNSQVWNQEIYWLPNLESSHNTGFMHISLVQLWLCIAIVLKRLFTVSWGFDNPFWRANSTEILWGLHPFKCQYRSVSFPLKRNIFILSFLSSTKPVIQNFSTILYICLHGTPDTGCLCKYYEWTFFWTECSQKSTWLVQICRTKLYVLKLRDMISLPSWIDTNNCQSTPCKKKHFSIV
jgi:hypothetical protein